MTRLLRLIVPLTPLVGDVIFDVVLVAGTMGGAWFWVHDPIAKVNAEFALALPNGFAIYFYHRHLKDLPLDKFKQWFLSLLGSAAIAGASSGFDPGWWDFALLFVSGHQDQALRLLDSQLHLNLVMIIGLSAAYVSLIGFLRLTLRRLFKILYSSVSALPGRGGQ